MISSVKSCLSVSGFLFFHFLFFWPYYCFVAVLIFFLYINYRLGMYFPSLYFPFTFASLMHKILSFV